MVANLEEVLTSDIVTERDFVNTEHLVTLVVIVPKNEDANWLSKYEKLGSDLAGYGEAGNRYAAPCISATCFLLIVLAAAFLFGRQATLGSHVVPGSAR